MFFLSIFTTSFTAFSADCSNGITNSIPEYMNGLYIEKYGTTTPTKISETNSSVVLNTGEFNGKGVCVRIKSTKPVSYSYSIDLGTNEYGYTRYGVNFSRSRHLGGNAYYIHSHAGEIVKELEIIGSDGFSLALDIPFYGFGWTKVQLPRRISRFSSLMPYSILIGFLSLGMAV